MLIVLWTETCPQCECLKKESRKYLLVFTGKFVIAELTFAKCSHVKTLYVNGFTFTDFLCIRYLTTEVRGGNVSILALTLTFMLSSEQWQHRQSCSIVLFQHSCQFKIRLWPTLTLTIATGDYWNVSVTIHAEGGTSIRLQSCMLNNFFTMRLLPIHYSLSHTHKHRALSASFDASLFTQIKGRRRPSIQTSSSKDCLQNECIKRLVILMNSVPPSPFTCSQYPTQSQEIMFYSTYTAT